jgi:hypothetical protein
MHRLSVAADAPALIIAVPSTASARDNDLIEHIAEATAESCAGATIAVAFLGSGGARGGARGTSGASGSGDPRGTSGASGSGDPRGTSGASGSGASGSSDDRGEVSTDGTGDPDEPVSLADALASAPVQTDERLPRAVVVPLLAGPHPDYDAQITAAVAAADVPVMIAAHLGPHPLLAGALHDRLSEVGLARVSRALGLSISVGSDGVLLVADRGPEAVSDAGLTAILLAGRLAAPVHPASLGDQVSIDTALTRLSEAGAKRPAISPCVIGPETDMAEFERLSASLGAACAAPLGSHSAVSQLIAARYGEALARMATVSH